MTLRMKPWLTYSEAALVLQRSKRTIRLWVQDGRRADANPTLRIRVEHDGRLTLLSSEDLSRVAVFKDLYRDAPTFGRDQQSRRREWAAKPCVYYVKFGDRVKIGFTENLRNRLNSLFYDEVLAIEPGSRALERTRHNQFAADRVEGQQEWFTYSAEIAAHIDALRSDRTTAAMLAEYAPPLATRRQL